MSTAMQSRIRKSGSERAMKERKRLKEDSLLADAEGFTKICRKPIKDVFVSATVCEGTLTPGIDVRDEVHHVSLGMVITLADGTVIDKGLAFDLYLKHSNPNVAMPELLFKGWQS